MTIDKALEADILRYHFVEKWRVGTIASQLGIHHSVVDRVISQAGFPKAERATQPLMIDPYLAFIMEKLQQYPALTAASLYGMAKERGYPGGPSWFRQRIAELRPRPTPEAYLRLKTLPGEQMQVDWGHFGHLEIGKAKRPLMAFVLMLSWSRQIFLRFYLNQQMANFLRGHVEAFQQEQPRLIPLPDDAFPAEECVAVSARKTPYIRFDLNDYSIPHTHVRRNLTIRASLTEVVILDGSEVIARHPRHYGKAEQIEEPAHTDALVAHKREARQHRGQDRLTKAVPSSETLLQQAAERGERLSTTVSLLVQQLDDYGAAELESAIAEALAQQLPHPNAVRQILERRREQRQQPPTLAIPLTHDKAKDLVVPTPSLAAYDQLSEKHSSEPHHESN